MRVTVVIPALNEVERIGTTLRAINRQGPDEVIVADGGSDDGTVELAERLGARIVQTAPGRGRQLAAGVQATTSDGVWVVHADTRVPPGALRLVRETLDHRPFGAFHLAIDHPGLTYRIIEVGIRLRVRLAGLVYGDQAMFFRKTDYERVGGFPAEPLMEDVALCRRFRAAGIRPVLLRPVVATDARRWERDGPWRRTLGNWTLLFRHIVLGHSADRLATRYRPEREPKGPSC